ncbi:MAG: hypothetical protein K8S27_01475 [Candidatus Omnitrophica bacterium]|nr:hypothetical protein [Candidatus Omnitrophota bacterium]
MLAETFIILMIIVITVLAPTVVFGFIATAVIKAHARNPSATSKYLMAMLIPLIFIESVAIVAILIIFQLFGK